MSKKYTAANFANARFAEHGKEDDPAFRRPNGGKLPWKCACGGAWSDEDMAGMDWVPVPTKPTITQARFDKEFDPQWRWNVVEIQQKLEKLGIEVTDPEPTDEQLLAGIIRGLDDWQSITSPELLAKYLNTAGVTPPKEDN